MDIELKWKNYTWIVALLAWSVFAFTVLIWSWHVMGEAWHNSYFIPILGYYVFVSICQSHYFKATMTPNWEGLLRQWVSLSSAVFIFIIHGWIMRHVIGVPEKLIMPGQFIFIVLGFFFFGWDDFLFKGQLSKWIKYDSLKAIFWYMIMWLVWYPFFAMDGGTCSALGNFHGLTFNWLLGSFQWVIMMSMMIAITWKDFLETVSFPNNYVRGILLFSFCLVAGFTIAYLCYSLVNSFAPTIKESGKWHHVLYMGTYPLIPMILFGVYSNHFNHIQDIKKKTLARTAFVAVMVVMGYLIFRFAIAPTGIFGEHHWTHHFDLVFNFTIAIMLLTHHWFNGRLGFVAVRMREAGTS